MITFAVPQDPELLAVIGTVAIHHGHLDYVLRMTIKTLAGLSLGDGIDATEGIMSRDLRRHVRKLARDKFGDISTPYYRLDALLNRSQRATRRRNELLHGLWAADLKGNEMFRHEGRAFTPLPTVTELDALARELASIAGELNHGRLEGFLKEALETVSTAPVPLTGKP